MTFDAYHELERRFQRIGALGDAEAMLHWDMATMMPPGGGEARADQLAVLKSLSHGLLTAPELSDLLAAADTQDRLDDWQRANLREMRRQHAHATALTDCQVETVSRATSACEVAWREARPNSDFGHILPALRTLLQHVREMAEAKAQALKLSPYDALLDAYEPDGRSVHIDTLFSELADVLPGLLAEVLDAQNAGPAAPEPQGPFAIEAQKVLAVRLMEQLGFDFGHGRLDVSLHPFCGGTPDDVRITTRYDDTDFRSALMGVLHETGHALYERGLPKTWRRQPVGAPRGMVLHESQSLLIEMQVCRSLEFISFAAPMIREAFKGHGAAWSPNALRRHYLRVAPGYIRVDADEVTYPAHVIMRYNLERAMLSGGLDPADLPDAWNEAMTKLLGLKPPDDRLGCLQDIHWYDGAWGYFPTYTLGAMAAAQLFASATAADPTIRPGIAVGNFTPLLDWLKLNVHEKGSLLSTNELLIAATGRPLESSAFYAHLRQRYLA